MNAFILKDIKTQSLCVFSRPTYLLEWMRWNRCHSPPFYSTAVAEAGSVIFLGHCRRVVQGEGACWRGKCLLCYLSCEHNYQLCHLPWLACKYKTLEFSSFVRVYLCYLSYLLSLSIKLLNMNRLFFIYPSPNWLKCTYNQV